MHATVCQCRVFGKFLIPNNNFQTALEKKPIIEFDCTSRYYICVTTPSVLSATIRVRLPCYHCVIIGYLTSLSHRNLWKVVPNTHRNFRKASWHYEALKAIKKSNHCGVLSRLCTKSIGTVNICSWLWSCPVPIDIKMYTDGTISTLAVGKE